MAASYFPALIIKKNNDVYLGTNLVTYGYNGTIPSVAAGGKPDADYWAVPITDYGFVSGFNFTPVGVNAIAPTPQSFRVFRLRTWNSSDYYYVRGQLTGSTGYNQVNNDWECCVGSPAALPTTVPSLAPTQELCTWISNSDQRYFVTLGVPTVAPLQNLYAYGYFNNAALPALSGSGYGNATVLVAAMNSIWGATVGGTFTLTNSSTITLVQTAGDGDDVIGVNIYQKNPSS